MNAQKKDPVMTNLPLSLLPARIRRPAACLAAALLLFVTACGGSSKTVTARPSTNAQLQILSPTPNQVTGSSIDVQFGLQGAQVAPPTKLTITPNQGHIHVSIDGKLISMSYGLSQQVNALTPGTHTLQSEFVANDHQPFANRVVAAVLFKVR
jgi:hypothetical protein